MKVRQAYEGRVIEARSSELKDGGWDCEFSIDEHEASGVTETAFYVPGVFPTANQIQLIDATQWFKPLRKNLGKKNCELSPGTPNVSVARSWTSRRPQNRRFFPNAAFAYWKVTVERPLRLHSQLTVKAIETLRFTSGDEASRLPCAFHPKRM